MFLIHDGDPSHTAGDTEAYLAGCGGWWRPRFTPAHASWLNQAELLIRAFAPRYLKRGSWPAARSSSSMCWPRPGVQPALRPPVRVDVDQSEDAAMVRRACH